MSEEERIYEVRVDMPDGLWTVRYVDTSVESAMRRARDAWPGHERVTLLCTIDTAPQRALSV